MKFGLGNSAAEEKVTSSSLLASWVLIGSLFTHLTVSPTLIVISAGTKTFGASMLTVCITGSGVGVEVGGAVGVAVGVAVGGVVGGVVGGFVGGFVGVVVGGGVGPVAVILRVYV